MWTIKLIDDPLQLQGQNDDNYGLIIQTCIVHANVALSDLFGKQKEAYQAFLQGERSARVALADFVSRILTDKNGNTDLIKPQQEQSNGEKPITLAFETLDQRTNASIRNKRRRKTHNNSSLTPFMLERTDVYCSKDSLHIYLRVVSYTQTVNLEVVKEAFENFIQQIFDINSDTDCNVLNELMHHVAVSVLQDRLRLQLKDMNVVAFIANDAVLPRKSGASMAPMDSPPAIPFIAPKDSSMQQSITIDLGQLRPFLRVPKLQLNGQLARTNVTLVGLVVPSGVTLIVGGGYHGKSTMLRCIAAGIYNKIPGDGREYCVTVDDAVTIRSEDGRYVNNCNISAFISNLPTLPSTNGNSKPLDTTHFSSDDASGSTSQAANVIEALEMGASAFLVDEDVSAANFMARDGRMRSLVMDESITPLLYRVNGLYRKHKVSTVVVVGGVGDWLDVPDQVILMDKYVCKDATKKARDISRQFSHGHVQYAGRGVVHRLEWENSGTPLPRRPSDTSIQNFESEHVHISLMEGGQGIVLYSNNNTKNDTGTDTDYFIDLSRIEQLMGQKAQLRGCGLGMVWVLHIARKYPKKSLKELLEIVHQKLDEEGLLAIVDDVENCIEDSISWKTLVEDQGYASRPRRFEIGQALNRLRGVKFDELPVVIDNTDAALKAEEERKQQELMEMWNKRRQK